MIPEGAWSLVPQELPPNVPAWLNVAGEQAGKLGSREFRALCWADHILRRTFTNPDVWRTAVFPHVINVSSFRPGWLDLSAGFIPFRKGDERDVALSKRHTWKGDDGFGYAFGAVLGLPSGPTLLGDVVDDRFPVVVEFRQQILDVPPHPAGAATSTCFARARTSKRFPCGYPWSEGVVTAQHVITAGGHTAGSSITMLGAAPMTVVDIDGATTIDAAILDCGTGGIPPSASSWAPAALITIGDKVEVVGAMTTFNADVLRVLEHSTYFGNMFGQRVFIDNVGVKGDSGAPTSMVSGGDAVGIYIGRTGTTPDEGVVQHIRQVTEYFEVDLYR